jgi:flagellar biosynthesis/type III secretory pathway M-ring protein FliF/YscJ
VNLIYTAILILAAFIAIWIFVVVPAEKRHHDRKLEMIKKKISDREVVSGDSDSPGGEPQAEESGSDSSDNQ